MLFISFERKCRRKCAIFTTRSQFHQHLMCAFFVQKQIKQLFMDAFQLLYFWRKIIGTKCTRKMLMKFTPNVPNVPNVLKWNFSVNISIIEWCTAIRQMLAALFFGPIWRQFHQRKTRVYFVQTLFRQLFLVTCM